MKKPPDSYMQELIRNSNEIEGIYDLSQDKRSWYAWRFIRHCDDLYNVTIQQLQKMITKTQPGLPATAKGAYRTMNVQVGGRLCPAPELVPHLMDNWLLDYKNLDISPMDLHVRFEKIHPFVDGNGRTGRMLLWYIEMHRGLKPTFIPVEFKEDYYKLFRS